MALSIKSLKTVKSVLPPRTLIYGPPKLGKTTLANEWPNTVFIQTEQGENANDAITTFGVLQSYDQVLEAIGVLYNDKHEFRNVAIDSLDKLEPLLWAKVCEDNKWDTIEAPGYGKGYKAADDYWRQLIAGFNDLRIERGMCITYIAHSEISRFDDPRSVSYSRFDIRLHKGALAILQDDVDLICFLNQEASVVENKGAFGTKRSIAKGGANRFIYVENKPTMTAGNRYGMPEKIPFRKGNGYATLSKYFPHINGGNQPEPEAEEIEETAEVETQQTAKSVTKANGKKAA